MYCMSCVGFRVIFSLLPNSQASVRQEYDTVYVDAEDG